jgi:hypothetical protein
MNPIVAFLGLLVGANAVKADPVNIIERHNLVDD